MQAGDRVQIAADPGARGTVEAVFHGGSRHPDTTSVLVALDGGGRKLLDAAQVTPHGRPWPPAIETKGYA